MVTKFKNIFRARNKGGAKFQTGDKTLRIKAVFWNKFTKIRPNKFSK